VFVPGSKRSFDPDATSEYRIPRSTQYYDYHWNSIRDMIYFSLLA
jgi:hypothetical protein